MKIATEVLKNSVICLTVNYSDDYLFRSESRVEIREKLVNSYQQMLRDHPNLQTQSCVVNIEANTAGSRLVRALYELWQKVNNISPKNQLICVGYPKEYIDSLISLDLIPNINNFKLAKDKKTAIKQLQELGLIKVN